MTFRVVKDEETLIFHNGESLLGFVNKGVVEFLGVDYLLIDRLA